jgi:hypothetical protein
MDWFSVVAVIAGAGSLATSLIIAAAGITLIARRARRDLALEFAAEGAAKAILTDRKWRYRTFRSLKYHLSGFSDDELRRILIRAGAIRLVADGQEVWGLLSRNRQYLCVEEINEAPSTRVTFDCLDPQTSQQGQDTSPRDEPALSRNSPDAFERVRAEMKKLGKLDCIKA